MAGQVQRDVLRGRELYYSYNEADDTYQLKRGCRGAVTDYESKLRHPLFPDNAYLTVLPDFNLFLSVPMCELHAVIIGLIEYIIRSCLYLYIRTLRNSDLVRADGRPLVSDAQLSRIARRLQERFRETSADETLADEMKIIL